MATRSCGFGKCEEGVSAVSVPVVPTVLLGVVGVTAPGSATWTVTPPASMAEMFDLANTGVVATYRITEETADETLTLAGSTSAG